MKSGKGREESIRDAVQHSKFKYILFRVFTDTEANHGYTYLTSDLYTSSSELKKGSWDLTIGNIELLAKGILSPIFIEIKSSFNDNEKLVKEIVDKIKTTEQLLEDGKEKIIIDQIAQSGPDGLVMEKTNLEYAIFIPGRLSNSLIDYISDTSKEWDNKTGVVLWSLEKKDADGDAIIIPYSHRSQVKTCRNVDKTDCKLCLCLHGQQKLLRYFKNAKEQELEIARIMPSRHKYVDPVVNIISILSFGKLFKKSEKNLGKPDLIKRMEDFFHDFSIFPNIQELEYIFFLMTRGRILLKTKGPIQTFHLNSEVSGVLGDEKLLIEEVVKRAVEKNLPQTFLDQF